MKKLTNHIFIKRSKKSHGNKYDYSKVNYINNYTKVKIICPIHGEFNQNPNAHMNGAGCKKCGDDNKRLNTETFVKKSIEIHGNKYNYSKVNYKSFHEKVVIICPIHGEFDQLVSDHLDGKGCKKCGYKIRKKLTKEEFIRRSNIIHNDKYDYSKTIYNKLHGEITIICPIHGEFLQEASCHIKGKGCSKCSKNKKMTKKEFVKISGKIHSNKYDYSKVNYKSAKTKVIIICPIHGEFLQEANSHLTGHGCKNCTNSISKSSQEWLDRFNDIYIVREKIIKIRGKIVRVDGFDPKTKTIYEFYGDFWHGNPGKYDPDDINPISKKTYRELYNLTVEKEKLIKNAGYNLITIWESDWNLKKEGVR